MPQILDLRGPQEKKPDVPFVELNDLTQICRDPELLFCHVTILNPESYQYIPWLRLGAANLRANEKRNLWQLTAYLADATDWEEDSAYALQLGLLGLHLNYAHDHVFSYEAVIHPDPGEMKVPDPGYDPRTWPDAIICKACEIRHPMISQYVPPPNTLLASRLGGCSVKIDMGPCRGSDEDKTCSRHKCSLDRRVAHYCPRCERTARKPKNRG